ncbi:protein TCL1B2-like isoform X1 [Mesocricetus auratus]|uniref:Protein TCL1B2-like isoform X1 n=1 Tax=Mesocricetus auratus TaxID=10036 RepID=A0ABM2X6U9_MESAU|nr:protein TCL1B2-like isoform X1 [Mesocricetus auratus]
MAAAPLVHPSMLTSELPGYYRDENQRLWMVVGLGISPDHPSHIMPRDSIIVKLWHVGECCKELLTRFFPSFTCLPSGWQTHSMFIYSGADLSVWKLVDHYYIENRANIVLLKEPELGLQSSSASGMAALNVR